MSKYPIDLAGFQDARASKMFFKWILFKNKTENANSVRKKYILLENKISEGKGRKFKKI